MGNTSNPLKDYLSPDAYKDLEDSMEDAWEKWPFVRIYDRGEGLGYEAISDVYNMVVKKTNDDEGVNVTLKHYKTGREIYWANVHRDDGLKGEWIIDL